MTKVMIQTDPLLAAAQASSESLLPHGQEDRYRAMVQSLVDLAKVSDELGYWGLTYVEHSLPPQRQEVSPAPLMLTVFVAQSTQRLRHGQLSLILPAHDPARLADEIAIADQLLEGRLILGTSRRYRASRQSELSREVGLTSTKAGVAEIKVHVDQLLNEQLELMRSIWAGRETEGNFASDGAERWSSPNGLVSTELEAVPSGGLQTAAVGRWVPEAVSAVPAPYSHPHPPLFQAFSSDVATLEWCGEQDIAPLTVAGSVEALKTLCDGFARGHAASGRVRPHGAGAGVCRAFYIYPNGTSAATVESRTKRNVALFEEPVWRGYYDRIRFSEELGAGGASEPAGRGDRYLADRLIDSGILLCGTVDDVKRSLEGLLKEVPVEYLVWLLNWGVIPRAEAMSMLELFANEIMPEFGLDGPA